MIINRMQLTAVLALAKPRTNLPKLLNLTQSSLWLYLHFKSYSGLHSLDSNKVLHYSTEKHGNDQFNYNIKRIIVVNALLNEIQ